MARNSALTKAPRIQRDNQTLPMGAARQQVRRQAAARHRLAQMVSGR